MPIIISNSNKAFDKTKIHKGDVIRAKYVNWPEYHNGIVAKVTDDEIRILYIPEIGNVTNYFVILSSEVERREWCFKWSRDLQDISSEGSNNGNT